MINFCYDQLASKDHGHPNLSQWAAKPYTPEWGQFDAHYPRTIPLRLLMYLDWAHLPYGIHTVELAPQGSWYPIALSWFDFTYNYFSMLSPILINRLIKKEIKILFYYHEGDNPAYIDQCLRGQLGTALPSDCYHIVSANSAADLLPSATYFPDHEFFFRYVNRKQSALVNYNERNYTFTMLNRTHKTWRASCIADLIYCGLLTNSLWSYHTDCKIYENADSNPIELDILPGWRKRVNEFVNNGPYRCDELDLPKQNDHHYVNQELYTQSYFQLVTETHFDVDRSKGVFITEKTYKPIKIGQPFIVIGASGTLAKLKEDGYRTFDSVLDNTYDSIEDHTQRWFTIRRLILDIRRQGPKQLFERCYDDIVHNQQMFEARSVAPLNSLLEKLQCQI